MAFERSTFKCSQSEISDSEKFYYLLSFNQNQFVSDLLSIHKRLFECLLEKWLCLNIIFSRNLQIKSLTSPSESTSEVTSES